MSDARVSVFAESDAFDRAAADVAARFHLPLNDETCDLRLIVGQAGRSLHVMRGELSRGLPITCDWSKRNVLSPQGARLTQPLLKAVGIHKGSHEPRPSIIDATAGFGQDAHLLASVGCRVTAIERNGAMAALLEDAVVGYRGSGIGYRVEDHACETRIPNPDTRYPIRVLHGDSITLLKDLQAEVVYLDPMFAPGRKTLERRPLRVLRLLAGEDEDAAALLSVAMKAASKRVVVKRPLRAAPLADLPPKVSHKGQAVRYDVYIPAENISQRHEGAV
ncbi:MAG: class I SAM-dependent methyltransferase [Phycisphaeraceae bacterium]|nr:class I SAM-dependent methyltransferase [Phycisphaeraceae bacterium]